MKSALVVFAAVVAFAVPAVAETPEEAVAYAFFGLADAATLTRGVTRLQWRETSTSPAVFEGHGSGAGRSYDVTFSVTAFGDCDYEVQLAGPPGMVRGGKTLYARVALRNITGISAGAEQVIITGAGFCQTGQLNPDCVGVTETDLFGAIDAAKHTRIVEELRTVVCAAE